MSHEDEEILDQLLAHYLEEVKQGLKPSVGELCARMNVLHLAHAFEEWLKDYESERTLKEAITADKGPATSPAARRSAPPPLPGYGNFEYLAEGGMGVVWKATDLSLKRDVVIKCLWPASDPHEFAESKNRLRREAVSQAKLCHQNVVRILTSEEHEGNFYIVLEFVEGKNLEQLLKQGQWKVHRPEDNQRVAVFMAQVARGVNHAHERGILHRDVKPGNILVGNDGKPRITDFGLAKPIKDESPLTRLGDICGTPSYMAPEQIDGQASVQSDVYGLGALLYGMLTGRPPFQGFNSWMTLKLAQKQLPTAPWRINLLVHPDLEAICLMCLEKSPKKRYESAQALADDLKHFSEGKPIRARRWTWMKRQWKDYQLHWRSRTTMYAARVLLLLAAVLLGMLYWAKVRERYAVIDSRLQRGRAGVESALRLGRPQGAEDAIEEAKGVIEEGSVGTDQIAEAHYLMAKALPALGSDKIPEALAHYQRATELHPPLILAWQDWAIALYDVEKFEEAILRNREIVTRWPNYAPGYNNLGNALTARAAQLRADEHREDRQECDKLEKEAVEAFLRAIEKDGNYAEPHYNLANSYAEQARRLWPAVVAEKAGSAAVENYEAHHRNAVTEYSRALKIHKKYRNSYDNRGNSFRRLAFVEERRQAMKKSWEFLARARADYGIAMRLAGLETGVANTVGLYALAELDLGKAVMCCEFAGMLVPNEYFTPGNEKRKTRWAEGAFALAQVAGAVSLRAQLPANKELFERLEVVAIGQVRLARHWGLKNLQERIARDVEFARFRARPALQNYLAGEKGQRE
jgi:protein kinase-like protein